MFKPEFRRAVLLDIVPDGKDWFLAFFIAVGGLWFMAFGYLQCVRDPQGDFLARHLTRMLAAASRAVKE